jgi:hypothetical protein
LQSTHHKLFFFLIKLNRLIYKYFQHPNKQTPSTFSKFSPLTMASQLQQPWKNASTAAALPSARDETWLEAYEGDKNLAGESSTGLQAEIKMNKVM